MKDNNSLIGSKVWVLHFSDDTDAQELDAVFTTKEKALTAFERLLMK